MHDIVGVKPPSSTTPSGLEADIMRAEIVARHRTTKGEGGTGKGVNFVPEGRMNELVKEMQGLCLGLTTDKSLEKAKKCREDRRAHA